MLAAAAGMIWVERRLLALFQDRKGPNRVGPFGVLQPVADVIKLMMKEDWIPDFADRVVYIIAPTVALFSALAAFAVVPFGPDAVVVRSDVGLLYVLAASALSVYGVVFGGWASQSRYPLFGAVRSAAQMISYEVFMGLSLLGVVMLSGSFDLRKIVEAQEACWFALPQFLGLLVFGVAGLAQTHRLPLDLPEAEAELVAGYHSEYSSMKFGLYFAGEYAAVLLVSSLITTFFLGGWLGPSFAPGVVWFLLKAMGVALFIVFLRASLPRPRYDQLLRFGWVVLLPVALLNLVITGAWVVFS